MERFVSPLLVLFTSFSAVAADTIARPQWQRHFDAKGVRGTFVLFEPQKDRYLVFNEARARSRYLPASTFKFANALIGLEVGSITDEMEVFPWDGKPKLRAAWERDQTLESGMRESTVWMFQEVARRTGKQRMMEWLQRLDYGNQAMAGGIDLFWLQGGLRISAVEQVDFLRKLAEGELPMSQRSQRVVKNALVVEKRNGYTLYAKTGSSGAVKNPVSWWVGWVERQGRPVGYFAMNFTPAKGTRFGDRFEIARAILAEAGVLPMGPRPSGKNSCATAALFAGLAMASGSACSLCPYPALKVCSEFFRSDSVLLGKIAAVRRDEVAGEIEFTIEVERTFKGKRGRLVKVRTEDASARWTARVGERRVAFIRGGMVGGCGPIDDPGYVRKTIREIQALPLATGATIEGEVTEGTGPGWPPAQGVEILIAGGAVEYLTQTDRNGAFRINAPPGRYRIETAGLGPTFYSPTWGMEAELASGQCAQFQLSTKGDVR